MPLPRKSYRARGGWLAITGLLLLGLLPVVGGVLRLGDLSTDPASATSPALAVAIVAHIVAMSVFCLVGAFQFSPLLRQRSGWHRASGEWLIPIGFIAALSSVPIGVFFGGPDDELALALIRVVFAAAMTVFLVRAVIAISSRDFTAHGAEMTRAYAIAVSGGTQALVVALWTIPVGDVDVAVETWLVAAGFMINSAVAELLIRRRVRRGSGRAPRRGSRPSLQQSRPPR
ncbi:DUF2306 domain-containing protein [Microcella sp.]|uniref:DUF2306 domain-containing protein n=1 Tax=Microcella sp. TaxID=1913979 RepID=UPI0025631DE6|nr:DUF2306 domain-containing protein [Microcella sp.]MBX9472761.1 DUF2306 domain-containing protein [Microcella sp.]